MNSTASKLYCFNATNFKPLNSQPLTGSDTALHLQTKVRNQSQIAIQKSALFKFN